MQPATTKDKIKRFTLDMSTEIQTRIKIAAARKGVTMREYTLSAIVNRLERDELQTPVPGYFSSKSVREARELQKRIFGEHRLPEESAELIRQAREERTRQIE